jgi:hypothetical protein
VQPKEIKQLLQRRVDTQAVVNQAAVNIKKGLKGEVQNESSGSVNIDKKHASTGNT